MRVWYRAVHVLGGITEYRAVHVLGGITEYRAVHVLGGITDGIITGEAAAPVVQPIALRPRIITVTTVPVPIKNEIYLTNEKSYIYNVPIITVTTVPGAHVKPACEPMAGHVHRGHELRVCVWC